MSEEAETTLKKRRNVAILSSDDESEDLGLNPIRSAAEIRTTVPNDSTSPDQGSEEEANVVVASDAMPTDVEGKNDDIANPIAVPAASEVYAVFRGMKE